MKTETFDSYEQFYDAIPPDGSLGVLALGAAGLIAWRRKRQELGLPRAASFCPETLMRAAAEHGRKKE